MKALQLLKEMGILSMSPTENSAGGLTITEQNIVLPQVSNFYTRVAPG